MEYSKANLICLHLVDQSTGELLFGGAERYTLELARLLEENGIGVRILHKSTRPFRSRVHDWTVEGLEAPAGALGTPVFSWKVRHAADPHALKIYVLAEAAFPFLARPAIGIQHGIWWESDYRWWKRAYNRRLQNWLAHAFDAWVCVDTNFINWLYAEIPGRSQYAHKLWYVPNFSYSPSGPAAPEPGPAPRRPTVLFPRRVELFRGALLFYSAMKRLWREGLDCLAVFCGPGTLAREMTALALREGYSDRVRFEVRDFDDMEAAYRSADVTVIPSIAREGTSLSCIEALQFGCPVIVTHVGGLGNLIIPGFNGLCVDLREDDLAKAIRQALESPELRASLRRNGLASVASLGLDAWRRRWLDVIHSVQRGDAHASVFPDDGRTTVARIQEAS